MVHAWLKGTFRVWCAYAIHFHSHCQCDLVATSTGSCSCASSHSRRLAESDRAALTKIRNTEWVCCRIANARLAVWSWPGVAGARKASTPQGCRTAWWLHNPGHVSGGVPAMRVLPRHCASLSGAVKSRTLSHSSVYVTASHQSSHALCMVYHVHGCLVP